MEGGLELEISTPTGAAATDADLGGPWGEELPTVCRLVARRKTGTRQWRHHTAPDQRIKINQASEAQRGTTAPVRPWGHASLPAFRRGCTN